MRNILWLAAMSLAACAGSAHAQGYPGGGSNPFNRPAYSPYLNLLRPGGSLVDNYYGLVRPQQNFRNALQSVELQQAGISSQQNALEGALISLPTGHASRFLTHSRYFLNNRVGGGIGQFGAAPVGFPGGAQGAFPGTQPGLQAASGAPRTGR
jgi:hypothetical protein